MAGLSAISQKVSIQMKENNKNFLRIKRLKKYIHVYFSY